MESEIISLRKELIEIKKLVVFSIEQQQRMSHMRSQSPETQRSEEVMQTPTKPVQQPS